MSGSRYQYDEQGLYFYYFMASVLGLVLAPSTYYALTSTSTKPEAKKEDKQQHWDCTCELCEKKKELLSRLAKKKSKVSWTHIALVVGWVFFLLFAYKAATTRATEAKLWDPYEILGLSEGATAADARRAFRKLSLKVHPDKVEPEQKEEAEGKYVEITKAYKALTDDDARKNWEEFGHPDGKQSISIGIALPSWLVEAGSRYKVLALYGLVFGIILPLVVSRWWQQSKILTKDQILTGTMDRFAVELKPNMKWPDLLILLSIALEFKQAVSLGPDGSTQPAMSPPTQPEMRALFDAAQDGLESKCLEKPPLERPKRLLNDEHAWKAYLLLLTHMTRMPLSESLETDRRFVVSKAAHLLSGMMAVAISRWSLNLVSAAVDLGQILVQACHPKMGAVWQLPGVEEEVVKHMKKGKKNISTIQQILDLPDSDRRDLFRSFSDTQYTHMLDVASHIPKVEIVKVEPRVIGEDTIETNAFITVFVKVKVTMPADKKNEKEKEGEKKEEKKEEEFTEEEEEEKEWWEKKEQGGELAHAPYWPSEKHPGWWVILAIPHMGSVVCRPIKITDLDADGEKTVRLQFFGPRETGMMVMMVVVRSDSYQGCDVFREFKFPIKPATVKPVEAEDDDISEPDEDTFAGQLAMARKELSELGGSKKTKTKKTIKPRPGATGKAPLTVKAPVVANGKAGGVPAKAQGQAAAAAAAAEGSGSDSSDSDSDRDSDDSESDSDSE